MNQQTDKQAKQRNKWQIRSVGWKTIFWGIIVPSQVSFLIWITIQRNKKKTKKNKWRIQIGKGPWSRNSFSGVYMIQAEGRASGVKPRVAIYIILVYKIVEKLFHHFIAKNVPTITKCLMRVKWELFFNESWACFDPPPRISFNHVD